MKIGKRNTMTEFRRDPLIRRWVVTGFAKSERPEDLVPDPEKNAQDPCPFCEGNEYRTPPETYAVRKDGTPANSPGWSVRVVPNRGTDLRIVELQKRAQGGVYDLQNASGIHETVVETPQHVVRFSQLPVEQIAQVLRAFQARYEEHKKNHLLKGLLIFRNHGRGSAGTFDHTHSQMVSLPFVPKAISDEMEGARRFHDLKTRCIFCDMIVEETRIGERKVLENSHYFAWCPFASRFPFEVWIMPKQHEAEYLRADPATFMNLVSK
jgi:UDPglucose--hexose-1-phosphate uridylyltransferase